MDGPPFMWESNSRAKFGEISFKVIFSSIISLRKFAFAFAAPVVPGRIL